MDTPGPGPASSSQQPVWLPEGLSSGFHSPCARAGSAVSLHVPVVCLELAENGVLALPGRAPSVRQKVACMSPPSSRLTLSSRVESNEAVWASARGCEQHRCDSWHSLNRSLALSARSNSKPLWPFCGKRYRAGEAGSKGVINVISTMGSRYVSSASCVLRPTRVSAPSAAAQIREPCSMIVWLAEAMVLRHSNRLSRMLSSPAVQQR